MTTIAARHLEEPRLVRPRAQRILPIQPTRGFDDRVRDLVNVEMVSGVDDQHHTIPPPPTPPPPPPPPAQTHTHNDEPVLIEPHLLRPTPRLVRPVAMKVARPVPTSAVEEFFKETSRQGIEEEEVRAATLLARDWHRKWTQQDEEGHTMPEPEADCDPSVLLRGVQDILKPPSPPALRAPSPPARDDNVYNPYDRFSGAKNPSPEDSQEDLLYERKRLRMAESETVSPITPDSSQTDNQAAQNNSVPRGPGHHVIVPQEPEPHRHQMPPPGMLVRPTALRVQKPQAIDVTTAIDILTNRQNYFNDQVPADIIRELRSQQSTLSPLTLPSVSSSYKKLKPAIVEDEEESSKRQIPCVISPVTKKLKGSCRSPEIQAAREGVLHRLAVTGGDVVEDKEFLNHLELLKDFYKSTDADSRFSSDVGSTSEGTWLTLTKPTFFGNLGANDDGDPMYTLGRMSFDMFSPTRLVCSLQGCFNSVEQVSDSDLAELPETLQEEVESGDSVLRTYNIVTAFTIEPHLAAWPGAPNKDVRRPIRGIMTTHSYILADPEDPNRQSVWITGGRVEPNDDPVDQREWRRQFARNPPKHSVGEQAKLLAIKLLMGVTVPTEVEKDGSMEYTFQRPLGGQGKAFVDTLYVDESLRIVQGHRGTIFVFSKQPSKDTTKQ